MNKDYRKRTGTWKRLKDTVSNKDKDMDMGKACRTRTST